jgi:lysozyme
MDNLIALLKSHEGFSSYAYPDSLGYWSIGYGKCIDKRIKCGISIKEAEYLLMNEIERSQIELSHYDWFNEMDKVRKEVLIELHFNIGLTKLLKFENMIDSLKKRRYGDAAAHMLDSQWRQQVGDKRSGNMASRLATGKY